MLPQPDLYAGGSSVQGVFQQLLDGHGQVEDDLAAAYLGNAGGWDRLYVALLLGCWWRVGHGFGSAAALLLLLSSNYCVVLYYTRVWQAVSETQQRRGDRQHFKPNDLPLSPNQHVCERENCCGLPFILLLPILRPLCASND